MTMRLLNRLGVVAVFALLAAPAFAAEQLPWGKATQEPEVITPSTTYDRDAGGQSNGTYDNEAYDTSTGDYGAAAVRVPRERAGTDQRYSSEQPDYANKGQYEDEAYNRDGDYQPRRQRGNGTIYDGQNDVYEPEPHAPPSRFDGTYSTDEIVNVGHRAFGKVAQGLAKVIEYAFQKQGRPNGYIIGQEAGGAFVAGLRYGEGILHTKDAGRHAVYWQGPSVGYDFGAEGSKTMILVYDIRHPSDVYGRFGGVDGSAYLVGGVGITFQRKGDIVMAPIRSGVGLRLGANIGYLKYSRAPTWNPF